MLRYACDLCGQDLDAAAPRYQLRLDLHQVFEPTVDDEPADDRDYLQEIHEILQQSDDDAVSEPSDRQLEFDLCPHCARRVAQNPLGRKLSEELNFSEN